MRLLFINIYTMGHVAYHDLLTESLATYFPEVNVTAFRLPDVIRQDTLGRMVHRLLRQRLPGLRHWDAGFQRLRSELGHSLVTRRLLEREIPRCKPDVIHIHTQSLALLSSCLLSSRPTVVSMDNTAAILGKLRPARESSGYRLLQRLEQKVFQSASETTGFSDYVRRSVVDDYGVPIQRVTTIYPATRLSSFSRIQRQYTDRLPFRILFVGNDFKRKGGWDLLAVFSDSLQASCELDIVSNDPIDFPSHPRVRIHRGVRPYSEELVRLYEAADLFVMPTYEDCLGHVFVEAMAAGLPTVGTTIMAVPEVVRDGITGVAIRPGDRAALRDAIDGLMCNAGTREQLGREGRAVALQEFDPETNATRTMELYRRAISHHKADAQVSDCVPGTQLLKA